ncbi:MAG: M15 family metallopeptidase, partial [Acidimicrobiia bacterium]|nr:M15 family metallopeptidase [Acidimicrobiia bacterium]
PGGLDPSTERRVVDVAEAAGTSYSIRHAGTIQLVSVTRGEDIVQAAPTGFVYPMASVALDPIAARPLLGGTVASVLADGDVVMGSTSAGLRGARAGDHVTFFGWDGVLQTERIGAIAPDGLVGYAELVFSIDTAAGFGFDRPSSVDLWGAMPAAGLVDELNRNLLDVLVGIVQPDDPFDVDGTLPSALVKQRFGEFSYRATGSGDQIQIDPAWVEENIEFVNLPILGPFRCHRSVVPYIEAAIDEAIESGLAGLIDPDDFQVAGGCYNPRKIRGGDKGGAISRHAWGIAIDINPSDNPYGGIVRFDERLASIFRGWGFAWGGGWLYTDGAHFEWNHLPVHISAT